MISHYKLNDLLQNIAPRHLPAADDTDNDSADDAVGDGERHIFSFASHCG